MQSGNTGWWLVVFVGVLFAATPASAKKKKGVRQVVIQEVTRVEGKIQKPEVWYLLPRSNLNFTGLQLKEKLVPKIEKATRSEPF